MPAMKDLVPSIGSSTQTYSASVRSLPNSSPTMPCSGKLRRSACASRFRRRGRRRSPDRRSAAALVLDAERGAEERQDGVAGHGREPVDKGCKINGRHVFFSRFFTGSSASRMMTANNELRYWRERAGKPGMTTSSSAPSRAISPFSVLAIAVVVTLGALYIVSMFLRNSVGVIAPNLAAEMQLTPIEIGLLSSIYFFAFAATQLPLGLALDRFGPKLCMLVSIGFTVLGCVLFAVAHETAGLVAARALLGFGTASFLMAPVALYARWFPPERFSTFTGIQIGLGIVRRDLCDRAVGVRHRDLRLAHDVSGRWHLRGADRRVDLADRHRRPARALNPRRQGDVARKHRRHLAGDPHAVDGPYLH